MFQHKSKTVSLKIQRDYQHVFSRKFPTLNNSKKDFSYEKSHSGYLETCHKLGLYALRSHIIIGHVDQKIFAKNKILGTKKVGSLSTTVRNPESKENILLLLEHCSNERLFILPRS